MSFAREFRQGKRDEKTATLVAVGVGGAATAVVAGFVVFGVMLYEQASKQPGSRGLKGKETVASARPARDPKTDYERCITIAQMGNKLEGGYMRMLGFSKNADVHDMMMGEYYEGRCREIAEGRKDR